MIELRIKHFYNLSSNKWYHRFNHVLYEYMYLIHNKKRIVLDSLNDLRCFYYLDR
jgi:hypothetical protein